MTQTVEQRRDRVDASPQSLSATATEGGRARIASEHLRVVVDTYKHHFDLFVKGWILYFAVIGACASYLSKGDVSDALRGWAAVLIALFSLLGIQRCQPLWQWVHGVEETIAQLSIELGVPPLSLSGTKSVVRTVQACCLAVAVAALGFIIFTVGIAVLFGR